ncbi:MAG: hypothetical protein V3W34_02595 [Phycisphaerae bacterium]
MNRRGFRRRALHVLAALTLAGGSIQVRGCDPAVRDTLLAGLETTVNALADTLIQTFFAALQDDSSGGGVGGATTI